MRFPPSNPRSLVNGEGSQRLDEGRSALLDNTVPAAETAGAGSHAGISGDLNLWLLRNDMIASQTQGGQTIN